jgi:mannose-6-phosphate isomerase-like protein (cupin superfamily)
MTPERCTILEVWNDAADAEASIALARVDPGITTQLHRLNGVAERYLVVAGAGRVKVGDRLEETVSVGDVVVIPAGTPQQISSIGAHPLEFYCLCTPRFFPECYEALE